MNAFAELMRVIHLNVTIYHNAMVCGDWRIHEKEVGITCFHMVTIGACKLDVPGHLSAELNVGDLVIFPSEIPHTMTPAQANTGPQVHLPYEQGAGKQGTGMFCGEVRFEHRASRELIRALPPVFIVPNDATCHWLSPIVNLLIKESMQVTAASNVVIDRLSEVLFIYAFRHFVKEHPEKSGFMSLYAHPQLSLAVEAIHRAPERDWTLGELARQAAKSRTQFAKRFRETSGLTPMQYLLWWRMQLAWFHLSHGQAISEVSNKVGYQSESSFLRAFKKTFGVNAGAVRKGQGLRV